MRLGSDLRLDLRRPPFTWRGLSAAYRRGGAVSVSACRYSIGRTGRLQHLPAEFIEALAGHEEVLVTSREGPTRGTVPTWFVIAPPGVVYLFSFAFSEKVRRWRTDPWIRLAVPGEPGEPGVRAEGVAHFVSADELDAETAGLVVERWSMQGAPTVEGLRRTLRDEVHA